jgi:hypothetical protein
MLGFGALRAMNDVIKSNRELLKSGKKIPFERNRLNIAKRDMLVLREKKLTPEVKSMIKASVQREASLERRKKLFILAISIIAAAYIMHVLFEGHFFW